MACPVALLDDERQVVDMMRAVLASAQIEAEGFTRPSEALERIAQGGVDLLITDLQMPEMSGMEVLKRVREISPGTDVLLLTGHGTIEIAVDAMAKGAFYFLTKPVDNERLIGLVRQVLDCRRMKEENIRLRGRVSELERYLGREPVVASEAMRAVLKLAEQVAQAESTVLIAGETGAGKEVVADYIHSRSRRRDRPIVKVNCGAFPETLLESELFGHEKGAFTGAVARRIGCLESAQGGTMFLDEIGEVSAAMQVKLLRVLQDRTLRRVGGNEDISLDVRFIVATNRNLAERVRQGAFRQDLFYRISVVPINVPPLRERPEDIPALLDHFLGRLRVRNGRGPESIRPEAMAALQAYSWPGNVRELENVAERLAVFAKGAVVEEEDVRAALTAGLAAPRPQAAAGDVGVPGKAAEGSADSERSAILAALERNKWNVCRTAIALKISRSQLYVKMQRYGLLELRPRRKRG